MFLRTSAGHLGHLFPPLFFCQLLLRRLVTYILSVMKIYFIYFIIELCVLPCGICNPYDIGQEEIKKNVVCAVRAIPAEVDV